MLSTFVLIYVFSFIVSALLAAALMWWEVAENNKAITASILVYAIALVILPGINTLGIVAFLVVMIAEAAGDKVVFGEIKSKDTLSQETMMYNNREKVIEAAMRASKK